MANVVRMPRMTDTMETGLIVKWHKDIGDEVKVDDLILEIETDKALMDLESYWKGYLLYKGAPEGERLEIDSILCIIGNKNENIDGLY
jgi:pyruvate dehydrogenase E2 component (dihydrolipoamide acetyltransferase)